VRAKSREKQFRKQPDNEEHTSCPHPVCSLMCGYRDLKELEKKDGRSGKWLNSSCKTGVF